MKWVPNRFRVLLVLVVGLGMAACESGDQQWVHRLDAIDQKLTEKDEELDAADKQIAALKQQIASTPKAVAAVPSNAPHPAFLDPATLESGFSAAFSAIAKNWKRQLGGQFGEIAVLPEYRSDLPAEVHRPYQKTIQVTVKGVSPKTITVNARADWSGNWSFPETEQIRLQIVAAAATTAKKFTALEPKNPQEKEVRSALDARTDKTITVDWNKAKPTSVVPDPAIIEGGSSQKQPVTTTNRPDASTPEKRSALDREGQKIIEVDWNKAKKLKPRK